MGAGNFAVYTAFKAKDGMTPAFKNMTHGANVFNRRLDRLSYSARGFGNSIHGVAQKVNTLINAAIAFMAASAIKNTLQGYVDLASDLQETIGKTGEVFKENQNGVLNWAKTSIKAMGLAEQTALDTASLFGDMATGMDLSTKRAAEMSMSLTQLSADLSSFKNIEQDVAKNALKGVFTGETEALKNLGVVMTQAALQEYALSKGIQTRIGSMNQAEKIELRYQYVLEKTKNAQGDFLRTERNFANQRRIWNEKLKQSYTNFGKIILPGYTKALVKLNSIYDKYAPAAEVAFGRMFKFVGTSFEAVKPILDKFGESIKYLKEHLFPELVALSPALKFMFKDIFVPGLVLSIEALNGLFIVIDKTYNFIKSNFLPVMLALTGVLSGLALYKTVQFFQALRVQIALASKEAGIFGALAQGKVLTAVKSLGVAVWGSVKAIWAQNAALLTNPLFYIPAAIGAVVGVVILLWKNWDYLTSVMSNWSSKVNSWLSSFWVKVKEVFGAVGGFIKAHFTNSLLGALGSIGWIIKGLNNIGGAFGNIKGGNLPAFGNKTFAQPKTSATPPLINNNLTPKISAASGVIENKIIIENKNDSWVNTRSRLLDGSHNLNLVPN